MVVKKVVSSPRSNKKIKGKILISNDKRRKLRKLKKDELIKLSKLAGQHLDGTEHKNDIAHILARNPKIKSFLQSATILGGVGYGVYLLRKWNAQKKFISEDLKLWKFIKFGNDIQKNLDIIKKNIQNLKNKLEPEWISNFYQRQSNLLKAIFSGGPISPALLLDLEDYAQIWKENNDLKLEFRILYTKCRTAAGPAEICALLHSNSV